MAGIHGNLWNFRPTIVYHLQWFKGFRFDPTNNSRLIAFGKNEIYVSNDFGETYSRINLQMNLNNYSIEDMIITNTYTYLSVLGGNPCSNLIIRVDLDNSTLPVQVLNNTNLSNDFLSILAWVEPYEDFAYPMFLSGNPQGNTNQVLDPDPQNNPSYYNHLYTGFAPTYNWYKIRTSGWSNNLIGNTPLECTYNTTKDKEIAMLYESGIYSPDQFLDHELILNNEGEINLKVDIPKGLKLTIVYDIVDQSTTFDLANHYDYNLIFKNKLFESNYSTSSQVIDGVFQIDPAGIENTNNVGKLLVYAIVEKDVNYVNEPLKLYHLVMNKKEVIDECISVAKFSNYNPANNEFFVSCSYKEMTITKVFQTTNDGLDFFNFVNHNYVSGFGKNEIIQSTQGNKKLFIGQVPELLAEFLNTFNLQNEDGHHDDVRAYASRVINGTEYTIIGNDGGLAMLQNFETPLISLNGDLINSDIYSLDVHESSGNIVVGLQDNATFEYDKSDNLWSRVPNAVGDGSLTYAYPNTENAYIFGDPQKPLTLSGNSMILESNLDIVSNDLTTDPNMQLGYLGMDIKTYRKHPDRFVCGLRRADTLFPTAFIKNEGVLNTTLVEVGGDGLELSTILGVGISENNVDLIYFGEGAVFNNDYKLFKTINGGTTFENLSDKPYYENGVELGSLKNYILNKGITDIAISSNSDDVVYFTVNQVHLKETAPGTNLFEPENNKRRVFRSIDGGESFHDFSDGLSALPVNKIIAIDSDKELLFLATDAGVYYRNSEMTSWECFSNNLPGSVVTDLEFDYCTKELYCSTYGRGVFKTKVPFDIFNESTAELITTNTTWSTDKDIEGSIRIMNGANLTITSNVNFKADQRIIVEPGAKLTLNNAHLSSVCDALWHGIVVKGNSSQPQLYQNQGSVYMYNSTVENSVEGVELWEPNNWSSTGGILRANNSTFKNNRRSISFLPYDNFQSVTGEPRNNISRITNCTFEWDDNHLLKNPAPSITMYKVDGVLIQSCNFKDNRTTQNKNGTGIFTIDAKYKVLGRTQSVTSQVVAYYDENIYTPSTFKNLKYGVHAMNANSQNSIAVDHAKFTDCKYGVYLSQVDNAMITRNKFDYTQDAGTWALYPVEIYTQKSTGYDIEGNILNTDRPNDFSTGIAIQNSGIENNKVFKNKITNFGIGTHSAQINKKLPVLNEEKLGLEFECEDYVDNRYSDLYVFGQTIVDGIKENQGFVQFPIGNKLSQNSQVIGQVSNSNSSLLFNYYYYYDEVLEELVTYQGPITPIPLQEENTCPTNFSIIDTKPWKPVDNVRSSQLIQDFNTAQIAYKNLNSEHQAMITSGEFNQKELDIKLSEIERVRKQMDFNSNLLIKNVVHDSIPIDSAHFKKWIEHRNDAALELELIDFNLKKGNVVQALNYLDYLYVHRDDAKYAEIKNEMVDFIKFKQEVIPFMSANGTIEGVNAALEIILRKHASSSKGWAKVQAQNLLCFFLNDCIEPTIEYIIPRKHNLDGIKQEITKEDVSVTFKVYPNPATDEIFIALKEEFANSRLQIIANTGALVLEQKAIENGSKVNVSKLNPGFYVVRIKNGDTLVAEQKLILE